MTAEQTRILITKLVQAQELLTEVFKATHSKEVFGDEYDYEFAAHNAVDYADTYVDRAIDSLRGR